MKPKSASLRPSSFVSSLPPFRFRVARAFKALDNGVHRKWNVVAHARDLPSSLPLDANARTPNIVKNPHCKEMRMTLLEAPELWQVLNSGIICTATSVEIQQDGDAHMIEVVFDEGEQGIVNGDHSYAQLIHFIHGDTTYSEGKDLQVVLLKDARETGDEKLADIAMHDDEVAEVVAKAREKATVEIEFVAPVADSELLTRIARARNLSQSVEATAFQNLAGRFEHMKEVLATAGPPFGPSFIERIVWKTNQEVPDDSPAIPVKALIHVLALMNARLYPPGLKIANEVYVRSGIAVREFGDAEGEDLLYYQKLEKLLPTLLKVYDCIYSSLPDVDPKFPWADGKADADKPKRKAAVLTPFLAKPCMSKVANAFVWPIFSALRTLLEDGNELRFAEDPFEIFEDMKQELVTRVENFHKNQAHGLTQQVGKDKELWVRLDGMVENEVKLRKKIAALKK